MSMIFFLVIGLFLTTLLLNSVIFENKLEKIRLYSPVMLVFFYALIIAWMIWKNPTTNTLFFWSVFSVLSTVVLFFAIRIVKDNKAELLFRKAFPAEAEKLL